MAVACFGRLEGRSRCDVVGKESPFNHEMASDVLMQGLDMTLRLDNRSRGPRKFRECLGFREPLTHTRGARRHSASKPSFRKRLPPATVHPLSRKRGGSRVPSRLLSPRFSPSLRQERCAPPPHSFLLS